LVGRESADADEVGHPATEVVAGGDDDEIDRASDLGELRRDAVSLGEPVEPEEGALRVGRVEGGAAARVTRPPGVDQVEGRVVADLADDDPGRGGAQRGLDQVGE
jgi:hypothetical protein